MIAAVQARSGWESAMACEPPSIWTVGRAHPLGGGALGARLMAWSLLATMNQLGTFFQPGSTASGSPNAMSAAGCWLAASTAASPAGRLAAKTPWNLPGWMQNPVPARLACGWGSTGAAAPG